MNTKTCKQCEENKPISEFVITARGVPHGKCNTCKAMYEKLYYHENKKACKMYGKKSTEKRFSTNMRYISAYLKEHPCIDCGERDIIVLDFDHRGNKKYGIANMRGNYSLNVVKKEVKKCDVRCANCHRRKTAKERNYKILSYV